MLPKAYAREDIDKRLLGELVDLIGNIGFTTTDDHGADDVLGRVYEYFQGRQGRRFSARLREAGVIPTIAGGYEDDTAFPVGIGFTDIVKRPTARSEECPTARCVTGPRCWALALKRAQPLF